MEREGEVTITEKLKNQVKKAENNYKSNLSMCKIKARNKKMKLKFKTSSEVMLMSLKF